MNDCLCFGGTFCIIFDDFGGWAAHTCIRKCFSVACINNSDSRNTGGTPDYDSRNYSVCVCVFFPFILDFNGRTSRGHTGRR